MSSPAHAQGQGSWGWGVWGGSKPTNPDHPGIQKEDFGLILEKERRKCNMGRGK